MPAKSATKYSIYIYMGALFNSAIKWLESGTETSVDDITKVFCVSFGIETGFQHKKSPKLLYFGDFSFRFIPSKTVFIDLSV